MNPQLVASSTRAESVSVSLLRAQHKQLSALLGQQVRLSALAANRDERRAQLSGLRARLHLLLRIEQEVLYPRLAAVLDPATLNAARYSHQRIEQHLRAVLMQDDGGGVSGVDHLRNLHHLVLAHQMFEEKRLFGAAATIDCAELRARIGALCADESLAATG